MACCACGHTGRWRKLQWASKLLGVLEVGGIITVSLFASGASGKPISCIRLSMSAVRLSCRGPAWSGERSPVIDKSELSGPARGSGESGDAIA